jgi:hypothetical protein
MRWSVSGIRGRNDSVAAEAVFSLFETCDFRAVRGGIFCVEFRANGWAERTRLAGKQHVCGLGLQCVQLDLF